MPPARRVPRHRPVAADTLTEPAITTEANRIEAAGYRKRQEPERRGHCRDLETPGDQKKEREPRGVERPGGRKATWLNFACLP